jgi:hypothetical protein
MENSQNPTTPAPQNGGMQGHLYTGSAPDGSAKHIPKAKLWAIAGAATVLVLGGGGYVLGYYIPSRPVNVYKSALANTADGYDQLIAYSTDKEVSKKLQNSEVNGKYKIEAGEMTTDGTFSGHVDDKNASFKGDLGLGTTRVTIDGLMKDAENSDSPDTYLKVSGIKGLGEQIGVPAVDSLDGQWVSIDHTLIDNLTKQLEASSGVDAASGRTAMPTEAQLTDAAKVIGEQSKKYLFTTDKDRAVLMLDTFVGKETVDGKPTNHYKVRADKEHLKTFVKELGKELDKSKLNDWAKASYGKNLSEAVNVEEMVKQADGIKASDKFDVWVNTDTKLVHKVRFAEKQHADKNFMEFGLNYSGGAEKPFFINFSSDKDNMLTTGKLGVTLNTDTDNMKFDLQMQENSDGETTKISMDAKVKPADGKVDTSVPAGSISLSEAMSRLGLGDYVNALTEGGMMQETSGSTGAEDPFTVSL